VHLRNTVVLAFVVVALSCRSAGESSSRWGANAGNFDKAALLRAFGECALGTYKDFVPTADVLAEAAAKNDAERTVESRVAARAAWTKAMEVWQRAELFQFGPAASKGKDHPGGANLRIEIDAWPLVGRCLIEQTLASKGYEAADFATTSLVNVRTLSAAEYLLFYEGTDNACPPVAAINAQGQWALLGPDEISRRKAAYALVVVRDVAARARQLADAWDPGKGNFLGELTNAGRGVYPSQQIAFNGVSDAAFYLGHEVKHLKLGLPAGFTVECASAPCPENVESPWAKRSKAHLRANLRGYEQLLQGCADPSAPGFDDLLRAVGAEGVAKKLADEVAADHKALDALGEPTLEDDIKKNSPGVKALFEALRQTEITMKTELISVLDLEPPPASGSDND
jgi:uncharacterized protein